MDETYLIWSVEHNAWWGPGRSGYTERVSRAGHYTRAEAVDICMSAIPGTSQKLGALPELPVALADVRTMVTWFRAKYTHPAEAWE